MDANVEDRVAKGNRPLHRDRCVPELWYLAQKSGGLDRVVIGERDHCAQTQVLDLPPLQLVGQTLTKGWGPVSAIEVEPDTRGALAAVFLPFNPCPQTGVSLQKFREKTQAFHGVPGVPVKGDPALKRKARILVLARHQNPSMHAASIRLFPFGLPCGRVFHALRFHMLESRRGSARKIAFDDADRRKRGAEKLIVL